jgi:hypothetical protein
MRRLEGELDLVGGCNAVKSRDLLASPPVRQAVSLELSIRNSSEEAESIRLFA